MLSKEVCMNCLKGIPIDESSVYNDRYWPCLAYNGLYIDKEQDPPHRCPKLLEQAVAAVNRGGE